MFDYVDEGFDWPIDRKLEAWGVDLSQKHKGIHAEDAFTVAVHIAANYGLRVVPSRVSVKKSPFLKGWTQDASVDLRQLTKWQRLAMLMQCRDNLNIEKPHPPNWSFLTGRDNNLIIIDLDGQQGRASLAEKEKILGKIPATVMTQSGRVDGGTHILLRPPPGTDDVRNQQPISGTKIDIRGWHGHAVIPGSLHYSGARYAWVPGHALDQVEIAVCPENWWAFLPKHEEEVTSGSNTSKARSCRSYEKRIHDPTSLLIGDGLGGFQDPIYKNSIQYFLKAGIEASPEIIIDALRKIIIAAPKGPGRDVSRYLSGSDLPRIVERARAFVSEIQEHDYVEFE